MEKEFVSYEMALALKQLDFDEPCLGTWNFRTKDFYYNGQPSKFNSEDVIRLPLYQQVFTWFREKYNMLANVYSNASGFCYEYSDTIGGTHRLDSGFDGPNDSGCWDRYEEAELACLQKMIEIVKNI